MITQEFQILLIDDDEDDYIYLRDLFNDIQRTKYRVTWKSSYKEGLKALHLQRFDACLLDYRLGEHTGLDLLKEVQKLGFVCPIIILTGQGDFDLDVQAMQMGASEYLIKGQLTPPLLERSVRYTMKHAMDMEELKETKAQVLQQDRLASLGLLASSLAHEIGTPLGIIRSRAEMVAKKAPTESLKQDMETVTTQIDRITKLVNSLLNLAREKKSEIAGPVSLNQAVQDVLNLLQHELERNGIALELNIPDNIWVKAESGPLGQVLLNLLVNAVHAIQKARSDGRKDPHKVTLAVKNQGKDVIVSIADTGCGIPEKNMPQLFKPFFTTKEIGHGSGLGLATSYKLVQSWNGSIQAESPNQQDQLGAKFSVHLKSAAPPGAVPTLPF